MTQFQNIINKIIILFSLLSISLADASPITPIQKIAEHKIRTVIEPLLEQYCHESCKLLNISTVIDLATNHDIAPGFDETNTKIAEDLAPSSGTIKLLIDDKLGPMSRHNLLRLMNQFLENSLDYPVKIETQTSHFPLPEGSENKVIALKDRVSKQFLSITETILTQFCADHCLLTDFNLQANVVNGEESQYGVSGEFFHEGDLAIQVKEISSTIVFDHNISLDEQLNLLEMLKLKTNQFQHVKFNNKTIKFPTMVRGKNYRSLATNHATLDPSDPNYANNQSSKTDTTSNQTNSNNNISEQSNNTKTANNNTASDSLTKQEKFERIEKIEHVENGNEIQEELKKFKLFGIIFSASIIMLLLLIIISNFSTILGKSSKNTPSKVDNILHTLTTDQTINGNGTHSGTKSAYSSEERAGLVSQRYEIERLTTELTDIYASQPKIAKYVFSKVLTEEGIEITAECIHIFGETIVIEILRDPSLQTDLSELMNFYIKNQFELTPDRKLDLLRKLYNRTIVGKLSVLGNHSSNLFDFLTEMDGLQILELIRTESLTVQSIVLTQCDPQKRTIVYSQLEASIRTQLLTELSRIDHLPKDYIFNVAAALKRKKKENPKLNTEALPGSEVLVSLLERTGHTLQKSVLRSLESTNPDSARIVKNKLVSIETLRYLRDGQLLEVVLSLKHEELIQFLKGVSQEIRTIIYTKSPQDLVIELEDEMTQAPAVSRETYQSIERKLLNRMKVMAVDGQINLIETNERMFSESHIDSTPAKTQFTPDQTKGAA